MKCRCCDAMLEPDELKLRCDITGMLLDTCFDCIDAQGSATTGDVDMTESLTEIGIDYEQT